MAKVVFVGGTGRCGTSVTRMLLDAHPQVATLPFEYRFIIDPDGIIDFYRSFVGAWSPYIADKRIKRLESLFNDLTQQHFFDRALGMLLSLVNKNGVVLSPKRYLGWQLRKHIPGFERYVADLLSSLKEFSYKGSWAGTASYIFSPMIYHLGPKSSRELASIFHGFLTKVVNSMLEKADAEVFVEDNTWNILFAHEILHLLPEAKVIHVYRDPRDVIASFSQQRWCPTDKEQAAIWYKSIIERWFSIKSNLPLNSYYEFKLEDLVESTESIVRGISNFIGLPFDQRLLDIDLSKSHSGRWKREFSKGEKERVHIILGDIIEQLGYDSHLQAKIKG